MFAKEAKPPDAPLGSQIPFDREGNQGPSVHPGSEVKEPIISLGATYSGLKRVWDWLADRFSWVSLRALISLGVLVLGVVLLVRPWEPPRERVNDHAALAWNSAIERLGIQPLYPPQEDFFVGDVYISLDDPKREIVTTNGQIPNVFKGRSAKIAQVNMRQGIEQNAPKFRFDETPAEMAPPSREKPSVQGAGFSPPLSLVAFPGISVKNHIETDTGIWGYITGRRSGIIEEITIPYAESYGASAINGTAALNEFCLEQATAAYCTDNVARKILSYAFGDAVYSVQDNKYIFPIAISIVTRVFLTRELNVARYRGDSLSASMGTTTAINSDEQTPQVQASATHEQSEQVDGRFGAHENMFSTRLRLHHVFKRPVAFGFQRISFAVKAADPPAITGGSQ